MSLTRTICRISSRWLGQGREAEAQAALLTVRGTAHRAAVVAELLQMKNDLLTESQLGPSSCTQLVGTRTMRHITLVAFGVQLFQQIQGISVSGSNLAQHWSNQNCLQCSIRPVD